MNYDDLLRELKMEAVSFPDISAEDLANIMHALENHFYNVINPVRYGYGRWVNHISENGATDGTYCSVCDYEVNRDARYNYCPNCGAKMDLSPNSPSPNPNPNEKSGRDTEE